MIIRHEDLFKDILIDCDVFRHLHFLKLLETVIVSFKGNFIMIDIVEAELTRTKRFAPIVKDLMKKKMVFNYKMSVKNQLVFSEHFNLLSQNIGPGESACMSVARFSDNVIGSSNLRDIFNYCNTHKVPYLTTLDFLFILAEWKILTKNQFDSAIINLRNNDYLIPNINYIQYKQKNDLLANFCKHANS